MQPISVEAFASMVMKNNKGYRKKELVKTCLLYTSDAADD